MTYHRLNDLISVGLGDRAMIDFEVAPDGRSATPTAVAVVDFENGRVTAHYDADSPLPDDVVPEVQDVIDQLTHDHQLGQYARGSFAYIPPEGL
jgi:hypothetical protein